MTQASQVAESNGWTIAQACGYLDGKRDAERIGKPAIPQMEMTEYAHGYWKGFSEKTGGNR